MKAQTRKIFALIFLGVDGKLSFTALFAFFSFIVMLTLYIKGLLQGYAISGHWLDWTISIIEVAVLGRVGQKVLMEGVSAIATIKKPKAEADHLPDVRKTMPAQNKAPKPPVSMPAKPQTPPKPEGNFTWKEFASKDGAPMPIDALNNIHKLIPQLEVIRKACGNKPITITSGYRSPEHNKAVGGAANSQHMYGTAADFRVRGMRPAAVAKIVEQLMDSGQIQHGGIGLYPNWVHYDIRGKKTKWKEE